MNVDDGSTMDTTKSKSPAKHHESLWLADGNVVLGTEAYLFKVHKSVLSLQSRVFNDMFALRTAGDSVDDSNESVVAGIDPELYEGLHFVSLPDDGRDVEHILKAVYERSYYDPHSGTGTLHMFIALIRLSFKYDFVDIRKDVLGHLTRLYPTRLDEFQNMEENHAVLFGKFRWSCHMPILKACVEVGIDDCFPQIYYMSSRHPADAILKVFSEAPSRLPLLDRLLRCRERVKWYIHDLMASFIKDTERCLFQHKRNDDDTDLTIRDLFEFFDVKGVNELSIERVLSEYPHRACDDCRAPISQLFESERHEIWDKMPRTFDFNKTWEDIRAELLTR